jgi:hypothetical protein
MSHCRGFVVCLAWAALTVAATAADMSSWYAFTPTNTSEPGELGMQDWIARPAGQHGRIVRQGDKLLYDGKPIKLWGINLCYGACSPEKELADRRAAFYPKYGINSVRLHKYVDGPGWAGIQAADSCVAFDPQGLDRMDYQVAQFKKAGIYVLLSAHFGALKLGPADRQYVPWLEELGTFKGNPGRITTPHSAIDYSPELQDVQIRQTVNLLRHKNPYTGLTYAEDPAVAFIEIINEQSILFFTSTAPLKASATLRRQTAERFCDWLRRKYGSQAGLVKAWGEKAFDGFANDGFPAAGEQLDQNNILPIGNPWYWDPEQLNGSQAFRRQRLLDTMQFLYELQCGFYDRYVQALREAGYPGEILGSNWQAGRALSHFYNLHSDWRVGTIDRHNYFGGGSSKPGAKFSNATMLRTAGSGTLSVGLQQALDRPFMLSEWIHVFPSEWGVEGPAVLGAYGFGLQGWDVSYMFQNRDSGTFSDRIGRDQWDATAPQVLGLFPAVARQVLRGDVQESTLTAPLYVHMPSWRGRPARASQGHPGPGAPDRGAPAASEQGQDALAPAFGFTDRTIQQYDVKSFDTDKVPARALAVARCAVAFTDADRDTPAFDLAPYEKDGFLTSSTGQLRWKEGADAAGKLAGYFTMDTPGTKAVVGFAQGQECRLGEVTITPQCPFAAIYVTACERDKDIRTSKKLLVVALARARNTGMKFNETEDSLLDRGNPPILLEPVKATLTLSKPGTPRLSLLTHDGLRTEKTLPVQGTAFTLDGARDQTPYYLIEF